MAGSDEEERGTPSTDAIGSKSTPGVVAMPSAVVTTGEDDGGFEITWG